MTWSIEFLEEAEKDMKKLDHSVQVQVLKGIRVVYKVERVDGIMKIIVISARTDEQVYKEAAKRREKHDL